MSGDGQFQELPPLSEEEQERLRADIEAHGVRVPLEVCDATGELLDGHHRKAIAESLGIGFRAERITGLSSDAERRAYAIRVNLNRRNLSPDQKAAIRLRQQALAVELKQEGLKLKGIAAVLGIRFQLVSEYIAVHDSGTGITHGLPDSRVKVAPEAKPAILADVEAGKTQDQVAANLGVDRSTVSRIVTAEKRRREKEEEEAKRAKQAKKQDPARLSLLDAAAHAGRIGEEAVDLLLTDPPYSTDVDGVFATWLDGWLERVVRTVKPDGRAFICTGAYPEEQRDYLLRLAGPECPVAPWLRLQNVLVWTFRNTLGPLPNEFVNNHQVILHLKGQEAIPLRGDRILDRLSVIDMSAPHGRGSKLRDWQKPDALAERLVRIASDPGALVFDPFCGTGTFPVVAAKLKRQAIGGDTDEAALVIAEKRGAVRAE